MYSNFFLSVGWWLNVCGSTTVLDQIVYSHLDFCSVLSIFTPKSPWQKGKHTVTACSSSAESQRFPISVCGSLWLWTEHIAITAQVLESDKPGCNFFGEWNICPLLTRDDMRQTVAILCRLVPNLDTNMCRYNLKTTL